MNRINWASVLFIIVLVLTIVRYYCNSLKWIPFEDWTALACITPIVVAIYGIEYFKKRNVFYSIYKEKYLNLYVVMDFLQNIHSSTYRDVLFEYKQWLERQIDFKERYISNAQQSFAISVMEGESCNFDLKREAHQLSHYKRLLKDIKDVESKKITWKELFKQTKLRNEINFVIGYVYRTLPNSQLKILDEEVERVKGLECAGFLLKKDDCPGHQEQVPKVN